MNNKYLVLGDLHGRVGVFNQAVDFCIKNKHRLICIGDYTDSWDVPKSTQRKLLERLIEEYDNPKFVDTPVYLIGNHDIHYMAQCWNNFTTNDWSRSKWDFFHSLYSKMLREGMLRFYFIDLEHRMLYTHAGLERNVMCDLVGVDHESFNSITLESISDAFDSIEDDMYYFTMTNKRQRGTSLMHDLFNLGRLSGGSLQGGITWCRPQEMFDNLHVGETYPKDFTQVVGHTRMEKIALDTSSVNTWFIDVLENEKPMALQITPENKQPIQL